MAKAKKEKGPVFGIPPDLEIGEGGDFLPLAGEVNWGMTAFAVDRLRSVTDGKGTKVGIVDTGVDEDHPLLTNLAGAKNFTTSAPGYYADKNGHGSHCSGTTAGADPRIGVAFGSKFYHGKGLSDSGSGGSKSLIGAMDYCVEQGCEVVSCSWGSGSEDPAITAALRRYAEAGVWIVAAAGNSGANTPDVDWPGRSEHCIDVAALASDLSPASFTSAGAKIDTAGPGVGIWSARSGGGYVQMSGTSMATPFVAGLLTLYRAALKLRALRIPTVYELRVLLASRSTDTHTPGDDRRTGPGWVTPILLDLSLTPDPPPVAAVPEVRSRDPVAVAPDCPPDAGGDAGPPARGGELG